MAEALLLQMPPKCIFIPSRTLLRRMFKALINKKSDETDEEFLFKFGLMENPNDYLDKVSDKKENGKEWK